MRNALWENSCDLNLTIYRCYSNIFSYFIKGLYAVINQDYRTLSNSPFKMNYLLYIDAFQKEFGTQMIILTITSKFWHSLFISIHFLCKQRK